MAWLTSSTQGIHHAHYSGNHTRYGHSGHLYERSSRAIDELTVVAFSTAETEGLLQCWMAWMPTLMAADAKITYHVHVVRLHAPILSDSFAAYRRGLRSKVSEASAYIDMLMSAHRRRSPVLFTDVDVVPLRPFSELLPTMRSFDLVFMREPIGSGSGFLNTGVYLLWPTPRVQHFMQTWAANINDELWSDQLVANRLLWGWQATTPASFEPASTLPDVNKTLWKGLRWDTFSPQTVAGVDPQVTVVRGATVAYHAIIVLDKRAALNLAIARGAQMPVRMCYVPLQHRTGSGSGTGPHRTGTTGRDHGPRDAGAGRGVLRYRTQTS